MASGGKEMSLYRSTKNSSALKKSTEPENVSADFQLKSQKWIEKVSYRTTAGEKKEKDTRRDNWKSQLTAEKWTEKVNWKYKYTLIF